MVDKGKGIADDSSGKRKRNGDDKSGNRKRKNNAVLQFFDDTAYEINESDSDEEDGFINDDINMFFEDILGPDPEVKTEPKTPNIPFFPKEEEMDEEEMDKMMEARYNPGASFVRYAADRHEAASMDDRNTPMPFVNDPTIWKVKCMVGREKHSVFCLMQKYVDLKSLGTKLQIVSAFAVEHVKGFIYIEAERQCDINEACKGLCNIYPARVAPVPPSDVPNLFTVRSKYSGVSVDTWVRMKNGKYKGDLGQVVKVDESKRKATVKLVPRIDLQAVSEKFGGGVTGKKSTIPAPRLITSSELEAYRPLVQYRRDRDTGDMYEVFDGMLLKDGYLFKKVPLDSLSFWDVRPSEAELIKFSPAHKEESNDVEWLTGLFGERKKKKLTSNNKGGKGEGSSSSGMDNDFEVDDPVFNGRKGFGVVVGREKDDRIKVLQEGSVVAVEARLLKKADFDKKFTAFDQHKKIISLNDTVRILEGPLEDKQGIVKQIYKGVIFLRDENESENCGYFCAKSQICEKMESSADLLKGKGGKSDASGFDDFPASPKSPLSPQKPFEGRENSRNFDRDDQDGLSVGQPCRIRVGPLKGYICRVMAIRYSDITVKLDSQHKILTVKSEHLAEVKDKRSSVSIGDGQDSKPFELLGDHGSSEGWMDAGAASQSGGWNTGGHSTERSSWAPFPSAGSSIQESLDNDASNDGVGASAWEAKATQQSTPWGASASENKSGGWGASSSGVKIDNMDDAGWGGTSLKLKDPVDAPSWGNAGGSNDCESKLAWNSSAAPTTQTGGWGAAKKDEDTATAGGWGAAKKDEDTATAGGWGAAQKDENTSTTGGWAAAKKDESTATAGGWDAPATQSGGSSWSNQADQGSGWGNKQAAKKDENTSTTGGWAAAKKDESTATAGGWGAPATQSGGSSWSNQADQGSGWGNKQAADGGNKNDCGSGWGSKSNDGGFSWSKPADGGGFSGNKQDGSSGGGGGNACFKCGESGHFSRECPKGGGGGGGGGGGSKNCFKCGEAGHMSRECPKGGGGGGGDRSCYKCGESGHFSRECPKGGGGNACFKCGEEGHMSRECPHGGGGGGKSCYKCGEVGHMSRECPQGGGGGGGGGSRSCFKCGESGHMSRECPQGGGGGGGNRNCYKCGESGHMSRECPQGGGGDRGGSYGGGGGGWSSGGGGGGWSSGGGGGGSRSCFKCGESGHMSRECPQGGGGGGGNRNCYKCGESGHMSRECPQGGGGDRGGSYGGGGGGWSSGGGGGGWSSGGGAGGWGSEKASDAAGKKDDGQSSGWSSGNQTGGGWGGTNASDTTEKKDDAQGSGWSSGGGQSAGKKQGWGSGGSDAGGGGWAASSKESDADGKDDAEWKKPGW